MSKKMKRHRAAAEAYLFSHRVVRARDLIDLGMDGCDIRRMVRHGRFVRLSKGVYRNKFVRPSEEEDLLVAALRAPVALFCLESAFYWHGLLETRPATIWLGLPSKARRPKIDDPAVRLAWLTGHFERLPVETFEFDNVPVKVLDPAAAVVHALAREDLVSRDVALAALRNLIAENPIQELRVVRLALRCGVLGLVAPHVPGRAFETNELVEQQVARMSEVGPSTTVPPTTLPPEELVSSAA